MRHPLSRRYARPFSTRGVIVSIFASICIVARLADSDRARNAVSVRWLASAAAAGVLGAFALPLGSLLVALAALALTLAGLTRKNGGALAGRARDGHVYAVWQTGLPENERITQEYLARKHGLPRDTERIVEPNGRTDRF